MQRYLYAALVCGSLFGLGSVEAKTIRVPGDFPSINGGLTSADYGDTVLVSPGRYYENVTLVQGVILKGANQLTTIIDGMRNTVPAGRFAQSSEIGGVIAFLCSPAAAYVNGINLPVDGGRKLSL